MAEQGARVLVLESETKLKDRVRGDVMASWGVAEAQELGIFDGIKAPGGREIERPEETQGDGATVCSQTSTKIRHRKYLRAYIDRAHGAFLGEKGSAFQHHNPSQFPVS